MSRVSWVEWTFFDFQEVNADFFPCDPLASLRRWTNVRPTLHHIDSMSCVCWVYQQISINLISMTSCIQPFGKIKRLEKIWEHQQTMFYVVQLEKFGPLFITFCLLITAIVVFNWFY